MTLEEASTFEEGWTVTSKASLDAEEAEKQRALDEEKRQAQAAEDEKKRLEEAVDPWAGQEGEDALPLGDAAFVIVHVKSCKWSTKQFFWISKNRVFDWHFYLQKYNKLKSTFFYFLYGEETSQLKVLLSKVKLKI